MNGVGIATPACMSTTNDLFHERIVSLVLGDDLVPRLSFSSIVGLLSTAKELFNHLPGVKALISGSKSQEASSALEDLIRLTNNASESNEASLGRSHLLPAGRLFHLRTTEDHHASVYQCAHNHFHQFLLSPLGWKHHRLDMYRYYLAGTLTDNSLKEIFQ